MRKHLLYLTIFLCFFLSIVIAELGLRLLGLDAQYHSYSKPWKVRLSSEVLEDIKKYPSKYSSEISVNLPLEKFPHSKESLLPSSIERIVEVTHEPPDLRLKDSYLGVKLKPKYHGRSHQKSLSGNINFNVVYSIDGEGRRVVPHPDGSRVGNFLLAGTSDVFGHGLNGEQTLPAKFALVQAGYRVYNYGLDLGGPGNFLKLLALESFARDIKPTKKDIVVYCFHDNHLDRVVGSLNIYRPFPRWPSMLPHFILKDGQLKDLGMLSERTIIHPLFQLLSKSSLLAVMNFNIPLAYNWEHLKLMGEIFDEMKSRVKVKFPQGRFIVLFMPGTSSKVARAMIHLLDDMNISTLDYSRLEVQKYVKGPLHLPDSHFSENTVTFLAEQIKRDLLK